jgi:Zn-finger nucleic acid-binding protein
MSQRPAGLLCPVCRVNLTMSERQGVEIDYCPQCRGVWLDRGELDKILDRGAAEMGSRPAERPPERLPERERRDSGEHRYDPRYEQRGYDQRGYDPHYKKHRRKSFLDDFFDFD